MPEMTLRQIEVIRAVMLRGTISGAAEHLGVSAPGISRLIKHAEDTLRLRLFERRAGLFVPSVEAGPVFDQIREVYKGVENLQSALDALQKGDEVRLSFASAPSVAQFIAARAIRSIRKRYPDLFIDLNILKIEETLDYLLLERGEFVIMSSPAQNPGVDSEELAKGKIVAILPDDHPLAQRPVLSVADLANEPLIGVDPAEMDPEVASNPNFTHIQARGGDLKRSVYRDAKWLLVDSNVRPDKTLVTVANIVNHQQVHIQGMLLTMKLGRYDQADRIAGWCREIRGWGFSQLEVRQLATGRCEVCIAASKPNVHGR